MCLLTFTSSNVPFDIVYHVFIFIYFLILHLALYPGLPNLVSSVFQNMFKSSVSASFSVLNLDPHFWLEASAFSGLGAPMQGHAVLLILFMFMFSTQWYLSLKQCFILVFYLVLLIKNILVVLYCFVWVHIL